MSQARVPGPGELLLALREQAVLDLAALVPADGGESASTFLATGRDGAASVLKLSPDAVGDSVGRLRELVTGLRRRSYPAGRLLASGQVAGLAFWLQERLPGTVLERIPVPGWLVPEVLRLNDAQGRPRGRHAPAARDDCRDAHHRRRRVLRARHAPGAAGHP
jgi:hypothetical protein